MGKIKDYTNEIIATKTGFNVTILSLFESEKNKDTTWNYICPYCGKLSHSTINHIKRGDGCKSCRYIRSGNNQKKTQDEFISELKRVQPMLTVVGKYKDYHSKVKLSCALHNNEFFGIPANLLISDCSCPLCIIDNNKERDTKYDLLYVKEWLFSNNLIMIDESEYKNSATSFRYKCLICGNTGTTSFGNLLNGRKCRECMRLSKKTTEQFVNEVYALVGNEYTVLGDYIGNKGKIKIRHNVCNHEWETTPVNFLYGEKRCPKCKESKGEKRIQKYLDENNILNTPQMKYEGLVGIGNGLLSYDFLLPKYNILIEYQGQHHDGTVSYQTEEDIEYRKEHDERKRVYAKLHNIDLLEIWYWDFENIEKILHDALTNVGAFVTKRSVLY